MERERTVHKLYCYVDETGQDTKGAYFVVSVIITQEDREAVITLLETLEQVTGKKVTKWHKTRRETKQQFIEHVLQSKILQDKIFYAQYEDTTTYQELTVLTVASAIHLVKRQESYKASIFIDGLQKSEVTDVGAQLRRIGVRTEKVRGVRDESHVLIRLADAIAGFIRDYNEGHEYALTLYPLGVKNKTLTEV
jgi:hypothetical protein